MREVIAILAAVFCTSCISDKNTEMDLAPTGPCERWTDQDMHCTLSMYSLITFPMKYDKAIVSVKGYVSEGRYIVLFADRESAEYSILENGIRLQNIEAQPQLKRAARTGKYVRLVGEFAANQNNEHVLDKSDVFYTAGVLNVRFVVAENDDAWGCSVVDKRSLQERFVRLDACRNLEIRRKLEKK
jgi:hypothetical protein